MTASDIEFLKVYLLLAPLLVVLFALGIVALTRWQNEREAPRRAQGKPPIWAIDYF